MKNWQVWTVRALAIGIVVIPAILALISPDGAIWGGGKGGRGK